MFLSYFVIVFLTYFWSAMGQDSVQPCFSAFVSTSIPPTSSIQCNQLYDCLQSCLSNPICKSILWDDSKYFCYHFSQTARVNPTILLNKFGTAYYERSSACGGFTQAPVIASSGSPVASSCPGGTSIAYFLATSVELTAIGGSAVPYTKEDDCLSSCTRQTSVGGGAALTCQSMNINVKTKTCQISASNGPPDGSGTLSPNPDAIYVQKFCLPAGAPSACNEQFFFLFPSNSFDGHTISTAKATSTVDCAGQCSTTASCQAGVFDTASKDCTLKNSNAKASPADLKPGTATSNYFENGCLLRTQTAAVKLNLNQRLTLLKAAETTDNGIKLRKSFAVPWGNWSPCQHRISGKRFRIRTRNCDDVKKCNESDIQYKMCM